MSVDPMSTEGDDDADLEKLERKTQMLRGTNAQISNEIESMGGAVEVTVARIEHLIQSMVEEGYLSRSFAVREQYQWERGLRAQLVLTVNRMRDLVRRNFDAQRRISKPVQDVQLPEADDGQA